MIDKAIDAPDRLPLQGKRVALRNGRRRKG